MRVHDEASATESPWSSLDAEHVVIAYNTNSEAANKTLKEVEEFNVKATVIQADVSDPQWIAELFDKAVSTFDKAVSTFGKLDIVVSNAGIEHFAHISEITVEDFDKVFPHCHDGGRLIMMSGVGANAKGVNNHAIYSASKASIEAFARSLAVDFGPKKITVNAIAPDGVKTELFWETVRRCVPASRSDDMVASVNLSHSSPRSPLAQLARGWQTVASGTPLDRIGEPEDIDRVVAFLCSEDGGWMNEQISTISGGIQGI
ncbi:MAG: hypothetical protein Q9228_003224 [Teloschistes exilis]